MVSDVCVSMVVSVDSVELVMALIELLTPVLPAQRTGGDNVPGL